MYKCLFAVTTLLFVSGAAAAQDIPATIAPPAGATLIGKYKARGVQIYDCIKGAQWTFRAPEAMLMDANGNLAGKHYAGPTWEARDGSKIVGKVMATAPSPTKETIPWLLLSVQPTGKGVLGDARFVQRINTTGGVGPTGACEDPGMEARSDYSAEYLIYK